MSFETALKIGGKVLTQAKKAYTTPTCQLCSLESLGLKMEQLAGDAVQLKKANLSAGFKSKEEIVKYFKNIGFDVRMEDFSEKHLETFNLIREDIELLRRLGVKEGLPKEICLSDWRKADKTKELLSEYGLKFEFPAERRAFCGTPTDTLFINSSEEALASSNGVFRKFKHEIGHRMHYTHGTPYKLVETNGSRSVLGQGIKDDMDFADRQLQILGIEGKASRMSINGFPLPYNITMPIYICKSTNFILQTSQGLKQLHIDLTKMTAYMNEKCHCYNKDALSEQIAEIFEDLLKGRRFDDLTMLMYDFAGGGRIPNLVIKGQKYDDYIKSLYENKELVNRLKEFIVIS